MANAKDECLEATVLSTQDEDSIYLTLKLSSADNDAHAVSHTTPLRVVCLIDTSGSMLQYSDFRRKRTKIQIIRDYCTAFLTILSPGDKLSIITFNEHPSMALDFCEIDDELMDELGDILAQATMCRGSRTNLGEALKATILEFDRGKPGRDIIVLLTDGEINSGITKASEMKSFLENLLTGREHPLNIAVVKTGSAISEIAYEICDNFSSHSYIYLDGRTNFPEIGMLLPVLFYQMTTAENVHIHVKAYSGLLIEWSKCNQSYIKKIRTDEQFVSEVEFTIKEVNSVVPRNIGIAFVKGFNYESLDRMVVISKIVVTYFNSARERNQLALKLRKSDVQLISKAGKVSACMENVRNKVRDSLLLLGDNLKCGNLKHNIEIIDECKNEVNEIARTNFDKIDKSNPMLSYTEMVEHKLDDLTKSIQFSARGDGHKWNKAISLESEIAKETLGLSECIENMMTEDRTSLNNSIQDGDDVSKCIRIIREVAHELENLTLTVNDNLLPPQTPTTSEPLIASKGGFDWDSKNRSNLLNPSCSTIARNRIRLSVQMDDLLSEVMGCSDKNGQIDTKNTNVKLNPIQEITRSDPVSTQNTLNIKGDKLNTLSKKYDQLKQYSVSSNDKRNTSNQNKKPHSSYITQNFDINSSKAQTDNDTNEEWAVKSTSKKNDKNEKSNYTSVLSSRFDDSEKHLGNKHSGKTKMSSPQLINSLQNVSNNLNYIYSKNMLHLDNNSEWNDKYSQTSAYVDSDNEMDYKYPQSLAHSDDSSKMDYKYPKNDRSVSIGMNAPPIPPRKKPVLNYVDVEVIKR